MSWRGNTNSSNRVFSALRQYRQPHLIFGYYQVVVCRSGCTFFVLLLSIWAFGEKFKAAAHKCVFVASFIGGSAPGSGTTSTIGFNSTASAAVGAGVNSSSTGTSPLSSLPVRSVHQQHESQARTQTHPHESLVCFYNYDDELSGKSLESTAASSVAHSVSISISPLASNLLLWIS